VRLLALSDLHIGYKQNRLAVEQLQAHHEDWLIIAGDVAEKPEDLIWVLDTLAPRFAQLIWVPGNHELYTLDSDTCRLRGQARYEHLIDLCRSRNVLTPEDQYPLWSGEGPKTRICPLFIGYDYSFCPEGLTPVQARAWAKEENIRALDEIVLHSDPYPTLQAWCHARVEETTERLKSIGEDEGTILINHYPLRYDLVRLFRVQRFSPWCGTHLTKDWHKRFRARVVVSGHLHVRATDWLDQVRFEEVSLGYPRHWKQAKGIDAYVREILPGSLVSADADTPTQWHR